MICFDPGRGRATRKFLVAASDLVGRVWLRLGLGLHMSRRSAPRWANRRDANEAEIIVALLAVGATVQQLQGIKGMPDLLVAFRGVLFLLEVKDPQGARDRGTGVASATALTPDQVQWHANWGGDIHIVNTIEEALLAIEAIS